MKGINGMKYRKERVKLCDYYVERHLNYLKLTLPAHKFQIHLQVCVTHIIQVQAYFPLCCSMLFLVNVRQDTIHIHTCLI